MSYTDIQVDKFMKKFKAYAIPPKHIGKEVMKEAAKPLKKSARSIIGNQLTKTSNRPDPRIRKTKDGREIEYFHGNLKRSISVFNFKWSDGIHVGPKVNKGKASGPFIGRRVDAWYAHFIHYGTKPKKDKPVFHGGNGSGIKATPFMDMAATTSKENVKKVLKRGWIGLLNRNKARYNL